jgi:hypothetical protein
MHIELQTTEGLTLAPIKALSSRYSSSSANIQIINQNTNAADSSNPNINFIRSAMATPHVTTTDDALLAKLPVQPLTLCVVVSDGMGGMLFVGRDSTRLLPLICVIRTDSDFALSRANVPVSSCRFLVRCSA